MRNQRDGTQLGNAGLHNLFDFALHCSGVGESTAAELFSEVAGAADLITATE